MTTADRAEVHDKKLTAGGTARVILFNPRAADHVKVLPNAILSIAASIDGKVEYVFVDGNQENDPLAVILGYLGTGTFSYFACTVMPGPQLKQAIPFARIIRQEYPSTIIVWGGYFASNQHETIIQSGYVDVVVNGPGDKAFPSILDSLKNGTPLEGIENIVFMRNGQMIKTKKASLYDQDSLPSLPYDKLNDFYPLEKYLGKTFLGTRTMAYHSSIGCPFTCSFCGVVPIFQARWKGKSAPVIYRDILYLRRRYGANALQFHDNNFFVSEKRAVEFASLIAPEKIKWWGEGRIDTIDQFTDASLKQIADSGCAMIFFGAESGNDALLHKMDKGGTQSRARIKSFAARIKEFGIIPEYSFVMGFPAPTKEKVWEQIRMDIEFIKEIKSINPLTEIIIYIYTPVPTEGSELYDTATSRGFSFPKTLDQWMEPRWLNFDLHREYLTPWLTPQMVRHIHDFETVLQARYPTVSDIKLTRLQRRVIKAIGRARYHFNFFAYPWELKALLKFWLRYRQPEIQGL